MNPQHPEEKAEEVDLEARARDRAELRDIIRKPLRPERLEEFARVSRGRAEIVEKSVWGQIRWSKSIGRPSSTRLADAFVIEHRFHVYDEVAVDDPDFDVDVWLNNSFTLSKWDLEDDENFYVAFRSTLVTGNVNVVWVRFADNVPWRRTPGATGRGYRLIVPPARFFNTEDTPPKVTVLQDFEVIFKHTSFLP